MFYKALVFMLAFSSIRAFAKFDDCQKALVARIEKSAMSSLWQDTEALKQKLSLYIFLNSAEGSSISLMGSTETLETLLAQLKQLQQDLLTSNFKDQAYYEDRWAQLVSSSERNLQTRAEQPQPRGYKARNLPGANEDWSLFPSWGTP